MRYFIYQPHIHGPVHVTSPDLLIDAAFVSGDDGALHKVPVARLTSAYALEAAPPGPRVTGGAFICAAGGGPLIGPALRVTDESGGELLIIPRQALRGRHILEDYRTMTLELVGGNGARTRVALPPADTIERALDSASRGQIHIYLDQQGMQSPGFGMVTQRLSLPAGPAIEHRLSIDDLSAAHWDSSTESRYTVGPTEGDVEHYI